MSVITIIKYNYKYQLVCIHKYSYFELLMLFIPFDHFVTSFNAFTKFNPFGVNEYSTRGGISLY